MKTIHFSTNGHVGINLCGSEQVNGDLDLKRTYQSGDPKLAKTPESFTIRAEERHGLMEYLNKAHEA